MTGAVCLMSGGLDSTVAAAWAARRYRVSGLHVGYGQRSAARELDSARRIAEHIGVESFRATEVPFLRELGRSALTDPAIDLPLDRISRDEVPVTQVPFRNGILLALATAWAEAAGAVAVVIGAVEEDSSGYPDCREQFLIAFERAIEMGIKPARDVRVVAPLVHKSKADIVRLGAELGVPFHLTWSCYDSEPQPCGRCESCLLRAQGFSDAGLPDPLLQTT